MKNNKILLNLKDASIPDKLQKTESFCASISGNAHFPNAEKVVINNRLSATKLEQAYKDALEARSISATKTALLHEAESEHDVQTAALVSIVEAEALGDEAKIKSAGMDIRHNTMPIGIPKRAEGIIAAEGPIEGTLTLKWKRVKGAATYIVRFTTTIADTNSWKQAAISTRASFLAEGLESGKTYWFDVAAVGSAGQGPWSDPATKVAP